MYLDGGHCDDDEEDKDDVEPPFRLLVDEHNHGARTVVRDSAWDGSQIAHASVKGGSGCVLQDADNEEEDLHRFTYLREEHLEEGDLFGFCVE